jgi:plasmid stabilization system protein ParE
VEPSTGQTRYTHVTAHWKNPSNHKSGWASTDITTASDFLGFQVQPNFGQAGGKIKHFGHVQFATLGAIMCAAAQVDKRLRDRESILKWVVYMYEANRKGKGQEAARQWTSEIRKALKDIPHHVHRGRNGRPKSVETLARIEHASMHGFFCHKRQKLGAVMQPKLVVPAGGDPRERANVEPLQSYDAWKMFVDVVAAAQVMDPHCPRASKDRRHSPSPCDAASPVPFPDWMRGYCFVRK